MKNWVVRLFVGAAASCLSMSAAAQQGSGKFDVIIAGGHILDGSGNPSYKADVAISGDRIAAVGDLSKARAGKRIDATGKMVTPGFIDIHSHAFTFSGKDASPAPRDAEPARLAAPSLMTQGVTTVVINHDGRSPLPLDGQRQWLARAGVGPNVLLMVGHGAVRTRVMGKDVRRPARPDEVARMRVLVREAMRQGAIGLSAGLEYQPGRWSTTDEVAALAAEIVPFGGVYISHERSEGSDPMWFWPSQDPPGPPDLLDSVRETIEIGERTGATVVASHIKAKGAHYWGSSRAAIQLIESARARGVQVYADQYPYDTSGTDGDTVLLPPWALLPNGQGILAESGSDGGGGATDYAKRLEAVLADPAKAAALRLDVDHEIRRRGGAEKVLVLAHKDPKLVGRTLADLAKARRVSPTQMAILLQTEGDRSRPGGAHLRGFSMSEIDLDLFASRNWVATASDAGNPLPGDDFGVLHPRAYGTFPRKIRHYAMDRKVLSLEDAVRSSTSLPAQILGLRDRGMIRAGAMADIVVFDPARIRDKATAQDIHRHSEGVEWVLINGRAALENGRVANILAGRVLLNPRSPAAR